MMIQENNKKLLIEMQCIGNIAFWAKYIRAEALVWEACEQFQKNGYRNRYFVLGSHGPLLLTIPVVGGRETKERTINVKIDNSKRWQEQHWKTLTSCYNKSPFFYHYAEELQKIFFGPQQHLWDLNLQLFQWLRQKLKIVTPFLFSDSFLIEPDIHEFEDLRGLMKTANRSDVQHPHYLQVFGNNFQQNLSILDLLFNLGPESSSYLLKVNTI